MRKRIAIIILAMMFIIPIGVTETNISTQAMTFNFPPNISGIKKMYKKVKKGMTYKKVKKIFNRKADECTSMDGNNGRTYLWEWKYGEMLDNNSVYIIVEIGFDEGKVEYKLYNRAY